MAVLAFAESLAELVPSAATVGKRTLIQLSESARATLQPLLLELGGCFDDKQLGVLQRLRQNPFDSELSLLITRIQQDGRVCARFL